ncbi:MAG: YheU family protein [Gammaproteobacteria bacterium]
MQIPHNELTREALRGLIEEFVTRDGTDYGNTEASLASKVAAVERQLRAGEAVIVYDPETGRCHIVAKDALAAAQRGRP